MTRYGLSHPRLMRWQMSESVGLSALIFHLLVLDYQSSDSRFSSERVPPKLLLGGTRPLLKEISQSGDTCH